MSTYVRVQEVEHEIGPTGRLVLRVTSPDVEIRTVPGATARVRVELEIRAASDAEADAAFESARFAVRSEADLLEVVEPRRGDGGLGTIGRLLGLATGRVGASVTAEVPPGAAVSYAGVSGDLVGRGMRGAQEYRTVSGDLVLTDVGGAIRIGGVSSDVALRAAEPITLHANSVSGDLSVVAPRLDESRLVTVSGDVELDAELAAGGSHRVETVSGDLAVATAGGLTLEVRGLSTDVSVTLPHRSEGSRDRRRYVIGDGAASLLFSSMSGDVRVGDARRAPGPPAQPTHPAPPIGPDEQLAILRALERGEIDVETATRRLGGLADG